MVDGGLRSGTGGRAATSPPVFAAELEVHVTVPQIQEGELGDFRSPTFRGRPPLFSWPRGDEAVVSKLDTSITQPDHRGAGLNLLRGFAALPSLGKQRGRCCIPLAAATSPCPLPGDLTSAAASTRPLPASPLC